MGEAEAAWDGTYGKDAPIHLKRVKLLHVLRVVFFLDKVKVHGAWRAGLPGKYTCESAQPSAVFARTLLGGGRAVGGGGEEAQVNGGVVEEEQLEVEVELRGTDVPEGTNDDTDAKRIQNTVPRGH